MAMLRWNILCFLVFFPFVDMNDAFGSRTGVLQDFCMAEDFEIQCRENEMIQMESALFGRMKKGRCIKSDLGFLGCHSNVLPHLDSMCSGKQSCKISKIVEEDFESSDTSGNQCDEDIKKYLQTQHKCVSGLALNQLCERNTRTLKMDISVGSIFSEDALSLRCLGNPNFIVSTSEGQQINVTLTDLEPGATDSYSCENYGTVVELQTGQNVMMCGGQQRRTHLILSNSNKVEVRLERYQRRKFMIAFEAIGCPNIKAPVGGQLQREGNKLSVSCFTSGQTWHLTCEGNRWYGVIGNCTAEMPRSAKSNQEESSPMAISSEVWLALIVACAVILCVSAVTFGVVFWRRRSLEAEIAKMKANSLQRKGKGGKDQDETEYMFPNFRPRSTMSETEDAVYDFCFSPGSLPKAVPNNQVATSVTLPCRDTSNLQYNNAITVPAAPESPKYKTLVFIKP